MDYPDVFRVELLDHATSVDVSDYELKVCVCSTSEDCDLQYLIHVIDFMVFVTVSVDGHRILMCQVTDSLREKLKCMWDEAARFQWKLEQSRTRDAIGTYGWISSVLSGGD